MPQSSTDSLPRDDDENFYSCDEDNGSDRHAALPGRPLPVSPPFPVLPLSLRGLADSRRRSARLSLSAGSRSRRSSRDEAGRGEGPHQPPMAMVTNPPPPKTQTLRAAREPGAGD